MHIQEKAIKLQRSIFVLLIIFGIYAISKVYITDLWFIFTLLGVSILYIILTFIIYKKSNNNKVVPITEKQLKLNKYILYIYMAVYLTYIIIDSGTFLSNKAAAWIFGPLLIVIAIVGIIFQQLSLKKKH